MASHIALMFANGTKSEMEFDEAGVTPADRDAIIGAIAPLCAEIVAGGTGCP